MTNSTNATEWLTALVMGAAAKLPAKPITLGSFTDPEGVEYDLYAKVGSSGTYNLYGCLLPNNQIGLLKVSVSKDRNSLLQDEAQILTDLQKEADRINTVANERNQTLPNYGAFIPKVWNAFENPRDGRWVSILGFHESIENYQQLSPLSRLTEKSRVDLKSAVWLAGKTWKILEFIHGMGYAMDNVSSNNLLVETNLHGVLLFDFTKAIGGSTSAECEKDNRQLAKLIWFAAGGTKETDPPFDEDLMSEAEHAELVTFFRNQIEKNSGDESERIESLYRLAEKIWPKVPIGGKPELGLKNQFHPWVTYPR